MHHGKAYEYRGFWMAHATMTTPWHAARPPGNKSPGYNGEDLLLGLEIEVEAGSPPGMVAEFETPRGILSLRG